MDVAPSLWPMVVATASFGAIFIGFLLMLAARQLARSSHDDPARVQRDGTLGVKLILGGMAGLVGMAIWRLAA